MASKKVVPSVNRIPKIIVSEGGHPHLFKLEYKDGRTKDLGELEGHDIVALYRKYDTAPPQNIADYYMRFFWDGAR